MDQKHHPLFDSNVFKIPYQSFNSLRTFTFINNFFFTHLLFLYNFYSKDDTTKVLQDISGEVTLNWYSPVLIFKSWGLFPLFCKIIIISPSGFKKETAPAVILLEVV